MAAGGDKPVDGSADEQRKVQLQRDEHSECEGEGRNLAAVEDDGDDGSDGVEQPRCPRSVHHRLDDGSHSVGLRCHEMPLAVGIEAVGVVEQHHNAADGSRRDQYAEELPCLLFLGSRPQPIAYLQVGDERTGNRECRADHAAHDEGCQHAARTVHADGRHDDRSQDECHQRHPRYRVTAHDGDGIGSNGGEKEGDDRNQQDGYKSKEQVVHHAQPEEDKRGDDGKDGGDADEAERQVALGSKSCRLYVTLLFLLLSLLSFHLLCRQSDGTLDDTPRLDDAYDSCHSDAADAYAAGVGREDVFGRHGADGLRDGAAAHVQYRVVEDQRHAGNDNPPHRQGADADDGGIFESDDVAQTEDSGTGVYLEHELGFLGNGLAKANHARCELTVPPAQRCHDKVVQTAQESGDEQGLSLAASLLAADQHLCGGCGFRERIFAVHVADEILAEGYHEQDAEDAAECRCYEYLQERSREGRVVEFRLKDVDGRQGEDGTCDDRTGAGSDALDDDIFAQCFAAS